MMPDTTIGETRRVSPGSQETKQGARESKDILSQDVSIVNTPHIDQFLSRLQKVVRNGHGWKALCPAHADTDASLSVSTGDDGRILLKCFAGCSAEDICRAVGTKIADLFAPTSRKVPVQARIVETHSYTDAEGAEIFQVLRYEPKTFKQRHREGGAWVWSMEGVQRELYQLPRVVAAIARGETIYLAEGERKVRTLETFGLTGTCNSGGAGKWIQRYTDTLTGANVYILPDNDEPGRSHAALVAGQIHGTAGSVRLIELPGLPLKGDIVDWARAGGTREDLERLATSAPEWDPSEAPADPAPSEEWEAVLHHCDLVGGDLPPAEWVVENLFPRGGISIIGGDSGVGKSWLTLHLAQCVAFGLPFLGQFPVTPCGVLVLDAESGPRLLQRRVKKLYSGLRYEEGELRADLPLDYLPKAVRFKPESVGKFADYLSREGIGLVIADPLVHFAGVEENSAEGMAGFFEVIREIASQSDSTFIFTHHSRKESKLASNAPGQMLRGSSAIRAILDSHLFLRKLKGGRLMCEHDKSRHGEPVPAFLIEITDEDEATTLCRYVGEAEDSCDKLQLAEGCVLRTIADAGGAQARKEIIAQAKAEGLGERTVAGALSHLSRDGGELTKRKAGNSTVYQLSGLSDGLFEEAE